MASHKNNLQKLYRYRYNEIACSPKRLPFHHSQTKGIRTELKSGKPLGCRSCTIAGQESDRKTLYVMETKRGDKLYFCNVHYVRLAKAIVEAEEQRRSKEQSISQTGGKNS